MLENELVNISNIVLEKQRFSRNGSVLYRYFETSGSTWVTEYGFDQIVVSFDYELVPPISPFIITVKTDNTGTSNNDQFTIPTTTGTYLYDIVTSDGQTINGNTGDTTITFPSAGTYDIEITGDFPRIYFNNTRDKNKLVDIKQWGSIVWSSMVVAFQGCNSLTTVTATGSPDLSNVTDMNNMFQGCGNLITLDVSTWDTSSTTNMDAIFFLCQDLTTLDVSNLDVSKVTTMDAMFGYCSSLTTLDVSGFDTSKVTIMSATFFGCNQLTTLDVSNWNTSSTTNMGDMFGGCTSLTTIDVSLWDVRVCTKFTSFMTSSPGMTTPIYDQTLINWSAQTLQTGEYIDFGGSQYTLGGAAEAAHDVLTDPPNNWVITDGGGI